MKPPLREVFIGRDLARQDIPESDLAFLNSLDGPALLHLAGRDRSRTRVVTTLLHGNEPSGLRAVIRFLRSEDVPATDVLIFIGSVETALAEGGFSHRTLPGETDANRCWVEPWESPQAHVARDVLERLKSVHPECLVDLHNNTGHNPAYGVAFHVGHAELSLISLFADRLVHTPIELGTLVEATVPHFPSVTIECGRAGDPAADEAAWEGLWRYLDWDTIDFDRPSIPLTLLESPVRVCVRSDVKLAFGESKHAQAALTISQNIDRHNFETMKPGSAIGWINSGGRWPLEAFGPDGTDLSREYFEERGGILRTRREFIPIMMTTNAVIAQDDCLFYAVQLATEMPREGTQVLRAERLQKTSTPNALTHSEARRENAE